jgi:hypothetical protein
MEINTIMQIITEWNKEWLNMEMDNFESYLLNNDEQNEKWAEFMKEHNEASWEWALSKGLRGNKISEKYKRDK